MTSGSHKDSPRVRVLRIETLKHRSEALRLVQAHNRLWMYEADDPEIRELYEGIVRSFEETLRFYEDLITELQIQLDRR